MFGSKILVALLSFICILLILAMIEYTQQGSPSKAWGMFYGVCVILGVISIQTIMLKRKVKKLEAKANRIVIEDEPSSPSDTPNKLGRF